MKEEITNDHKKIHSQTPDQIKKVEAQLKAAMIEHEGLRNRSMRSKLVFKNISEEQNETWEDTCHILSNFTTAKLDLSYTKEFIDSIISRAHHRVQKEERNNDHQQQKGNKPIFVQFVNWHIAEEIKSEVIQLNAQKWKKVVVNQMYLKELTIRRNNALQRWHKIFEENGSIQIKLVYPAILKFKNKGPKNKWETLDVFQIIRT